MVTMLKSLSLKTIIWLVIVMMGGLGVILTLTSIQWYQSLVFDAQRESTSHLLKLENDERLETLRMNVIDLALTLQADDDFRRAFAHGDREAMRVQLNDQFNQYFVTTGLIDLARIAVYDVGLNAIVMSDAGEIEPTPGAICTTLFEEVGARRGAERLKPAATLCRFGDQTYHSVLVPIGGLKPTGYLSVVSNPFNELQRAGESLGRPIRITLPGGESVYQSEGWDRLPEERLIAAYHHGDPTPLYTLHIASEIGKLMARLDRLSLIILLLGLLLTLSAIFVARYLLRRVIIQPLRQLNRHFADVHSDHSRLEELLAIEGCQELSQLVSQFNRMSSRLVLLQRELRDMVFTDELTKLPNRGYFYEQLDQHIERCQRQRKRFTLFMIDLNKFKQVNDTLGHQVGDQLLQLVAARFRLRIRRSDIAARLGGDEFALLLPTIETREAAVTFAEQLTAVISEPYTIDGHAIEIGMSVGIAFYPDTATDSDSLVSCADKAMYHAKQNRLGSFCCDSQGCNSGCGLDDHRVAIGPR